MKRLVELLRRDMITEFSGIFNQSVTGVTEYNKHGSKTPKIIQNMNQIHTYSTVSMNKIIYENPCTYNLKRVCFVSRSI